MTSFIKPPILQLERIKKYCSHPASQE